MVAVKSNYRLISTDKSFCPNCNKPVDLLTSDRFPKFYICFNGCKFVGEVGVGPVEKEE